MMALPGTATGVPLIRLVTAMDPSEYHATTHSAPRQAMEGLHSVRDVLAMSKRGVMTWPSRSRRMPSMSLVFPWVHTAV